MVEINQELTWTMSTEPSSTANLSHSNGSSSASHGVTTTTFFTTTTINSTSSIPNVTNAAIPDEIFLQTAAAKGITGACTFLALLITCHQVCICIVCLCINN